jgi:isoleucyl-tRNA synthetase
MAPELKDTLQLPRTDFPMRAGLVQREPARLAHWDKIALYDAIQTKRAGAPSFVLHDGPPFTNGDVHIGTALNKTLKDIILHYKSLRGFRTPYVPGWDCHGLPIEQKVTRSLQEKKQTVTTTELRQLCDDFSESWIAKQTAQFKRLGVLADWKHEYKTKDPAFEADILRTFAAFIEKGMVYRAKKPVYWSIPFETALAEAEIEYRDHVSPSIWVKFLLPSAEVEKSGLIALLPETEKVDGRSKKPVYFLIWTTTPWTIPANLAIALNPKGSYTLIEDENGWYVISYEATARIQTDLRRTLEERGQPPKEFLPCGTARYIEGAKLEHLQARHPFIDRAAPVVLADYVTTDSGTGCVHTAPGHGVEDYLTGLKYGLEIYCPVGDDGRYVDDGRIPADLVGLTTLETGEDETKKRTSPANFAVLKKLEAAGALLAHGRFSHSYPHCWRSKTPIVFRAVDQWFVSLDKGGARQAALGAIDGVQWVPRWGEARIRGAVESRPDWCISRQRSWGVPIPAFFDAQRRAYLDAGVVRALADKVERDGTRLWFDSTPEQLLAGVALPAGWPAASELTRGRDTLDVWFDSGSTHSAVLKRGRGGTHWPADLYLEGSDQHRGWFQSSLWTAIVALGGAPYRTVLTHGFIVDEERKKISKSNTYEKPQTSDVYIAEYGADVIRLWISSQDFRDDIPISKEILSHVGETYRLLRNTLRFQLSNLFDYVPSRDIVPLERMDALDRWALHQAAEMVRQCAAAYEAYEFHQVYQVCNQFCSVTLSKIYHDILKDRLYTLNAAHPLRRSSQTALHHLFHTLVRVLAPIIPFTTDEAWSYAMAGTEYAADSVHLQDWPELPAAWTDAGLAGEFDRLLGLRAQANVKMEALRQQGSIGKALDAAARLAGAKTDPLFATALKHQAILAELLNTSHVEVEDHPLDRPCSIDVVPARELGFVRCPRCWRWVPALQSTGSAELCPRCADAIGARVN